MPAPAVQHFTDILRTYDIPPNPKFWVDVDRAFGMFAAELRLQAEQVPTKLAKESDRALEAARSLQTAITSLGSMTWMLINEGTQNGQETDVLTRATQDLGLLVQVLESGAKNVRDVTKQMRGRPRDNASLVMLAKLARALKDHLGVKPTGTKEGLFSQLGAVLLEAGTGREPHEHHELIRRALLVRVLVGEHGPVFHLSPRPRPGRRKAHSSPRKVPEKPPT